MRSSHLHFTPGDILLCAIGWGAVAIYAYTGETDLALLQAYVELNYA
jgi:hypothetical protein